MQTNSNIPGLFDRHFYDPNREKFVRVHRLECEEVLDNLGYVAVDRNNVYTGASDQELSEGIDQFRKEYRAWSQAFRQGGEFWIENDATLSKFTNRESRINAENPMLSSSDRSFDDEDHRPSSPGRNFNDKGKSFKGKQASGPDSSTLLSEDELSILHHLSSLEGEFDLHRFSLGQISSCSILSRMLNYRFSILGLSDGTVHPEADPHWPLYLEKLSRWCGISSQSLVIELSGNAERLSEILARQDVYPGSRYQHLVYFKSPVNRFSKKIRRLAGDKERFRSRFPFIPSGSIARFEQILADSKLLEEAAADELNRLMARLVQVRLRLLGTYPGRLDSDLGPLTLEGICSLMDYIRENFGESKGFVLGDLLMHLQGDYWVLNATYLFKALLPVLFEKDEADKTGAEENQVQTLSEGIGRLLSGAAVRQETKESILLRLDEELQKGYATVSSPARKSCTRAGKGLLRSIGQFFRHVRELIVKGIQKVVSLLKKLFRWFKNAAQMIWRELKTIYSVMRQALGFFFSKRTIITGQGDQRIVTDYDGGFDSITVLSVGSGTLIEEHVRSIESYSQALVQASAIAGVIISLALKALTGPCGWIRLGVEAIRRLG